MQAREQVTRHVLVPEVVDLGLTVGVSLPLGLERGVDHVDHFDQKRAGAGGGIEYPHEVLIRRHAIGYLHARETIRHLCPGRCIGQAVVQPEFFAQQGVQRAHDVTHDRAWRIEDAALHTLFGIILLQKRLVEVDYRIFPRIAVAEITQHGFYVHRVDHLQHLGGAEFIEVDPGPVRGASASADL